MAAQFRQYRFRVYVCRIPSTDLPQCEFADPGLWKGLIIKSAAPELRFTVEKLENRVIQFLDQRIYSEEGLCWEYGKEDPKPALSKMSRHSKAENTGVVKSFIRNTLHWSCIDFISKTTEGQLKRLGGAGYEDEFIKRHLHLHTKEKIESKTRQKYRLLWSRIFITFRITWTRVISSLESKTSFKTEVHEYRNAHFEKSISCENSVLCMKFRWHAVSHM